jgi:hypothetical protein
MPACTNCGADVENKNNAGHFYEQCGACIRAVAESRTPHYEACDDPECLVCQSYREEFFDAG